MRCLLKGLGFFILLFFQTNLQAQTALEIAHWWTSKGEAKAVDQIRQAFEATGYEWNDMSVVGGAGDNLTIVLKSRVSSGNPPSAVQVYLGPNVWMWAEESDLVTFNEIAERDKWDEILPSLVFRLNQYKGDLVAVPINAHRVNWMWINPKVFKKAGVRIPRNWDEFWIAADKIKTAGLTPIAIGGEPWQIATLFENVLLGVGGADFHRKVFKDLDLEVIQSQKMVDVFDIMRRIKKYVDKDYPGRSWDATTEMVMHNDAAIQFMGDWAKGEFLSAGRKVGTDFECQPAFGTDDYFLLSVDTFIMFKSMDPDVTAGQKKLAETMISRKVQESFNFYKGAAPIRMDISAEGFDVCGKKSIADLNRANKTSKVVPAFSYEQGTALELVEPLFSLVATHFNTDMSSEAATEKFALIVSIMK